MATFGQIPSNVNFNNFQVVTSSTRPSSPDEGDHIYETDTKLVYFWNGTAWKATLLGDPLTVAGRSNPANTTILTTEETEDTINLAVPTHWASYDIDVFGSWRLVETTVDDNQRDQNFWYRLEGATLGDIAVRVNGGTSQNVIGVSLYGFTEGETTTGTRSITLSSQASGGSGSWSMQSIRWTAVARRTA